MDDRDFYCDADYPDDQPADCAACEPSAGTIHVLRPIEGETGADQIRRFAALVPPPPRMTPAEFRERMERDRATWAAIVKRGDSDDEVVEYGPHGEVFVGKDRELTGWLIRDTPPADEQAADEKKETKHD